jgi:signal-transduction protein with cAMP-binding, CBS, and nucleotidyltransferase domain
MELSRNLRVDSVSRLKPPSPLGIDAGRWVGEAVEVMRRERTGCLLVTRGGKLAGIFTERDLLTRVLAAGRPLTTAVEDVMTVDPVSVGPKDPIRTAIRRMEDGGYRHLPVVDEDGRPVGVLSAKAVVRYLVEHFPGTVYNLPPDPANNDPASPEGA